MLNARTISCAGVLAVVGVLLSTSTSRVDAQPTRYATTQVIQANASVGNMASAYALPVEWWGQAAAWSFGGAIAGAKGGWVGAGLGAAGGFIGYALGDWAQQNGGLTHRQTFFAVRALD